MGRDRRECWVCGWRTKWSLTRALVPTMCNTTTTTTMMAPTTPTTSSLNKEKEEKEVVNKGAKGGKDKLLDKDWGAKIPDYISRSILSLLVFIMGLTMKGDWLLVLALKERASKGPEVVVIEVKEAQQGDLAMWLQQRFNGYFSILVPSVLVGYVLFFGIGGYLHMKYYVGQRDKAHLWKCQPNNWLPRRDEIHEMVVGWFSLTLGSVLSAGLATWIFNGGYTSLYFEFGKHGILWSLLEFPIVFIPTDYITYWLHRIYHMPFLYKHFHKLHHTYKQPTAFSVTAIHPVEFFNIQAVYIAPMFLMDIHAGVYIFYILYIYYHGIVDHSGITFKALWFQPWQPDCIFHDNHHQYFHVNFGFNVTLWDRLHGTLRQKDKIYREDIFWGKGKDINEATEEERLADMGERMDENPLAYGDNKNKYL